MKIITTVGASLILNNLPRLREEMSNQPYLDELFDGRRNSEFKKQIWASIGTLTSKAKDRKSRAAAEIASIEKIDPTGKADIYLICMETVLSRLCGEVLANYFGERVKKIFVAKGLQVKDVGRFKKEGVVNLLNHLTEIAQGGNYWDDCVLNITGGYKAVIPILTIIGQIKKLPIYYIFEESDHEKYALIEIPKMPIDFQMEIFERFWPEFARFGVHSDEVMESHSCSQDFLNDCSSCLEIEGDMITINPIGKILWWNYQQRFFSLMTSDEVWSEIEQQPAIKRILENKFCHAESRANKTERKQDHYVFDDGDNNNRIYYFTHDGAIYIYQTFVNEEKARTYINTPFQESDRIKYIKQSTPKRIQIQR